MDNIRLSLTDRAGNANFISIGIDPLLDWSYILNEENNEIRLYSYKHKGEAKDITIYDTYTVNNKKYNTFISMDGGNYFRLFRTNGIKSITFKNGVKFGEVSRLFQRCVDLVSIDFSDIGISDFTDFSYMFDGCKNLKTINWGNNKFNVVNLEYMFYGCEKIESIDLSNFNTSNATNMEYMFYECINLSALNIDGLITSNVTNMDFMFCKCENLGDLTIPFDTQKVESMSNMFNECKNLKSLDLASFNTSKVKNMIGMFQYCSNLINIFVSKTKWIISQADTMMMFSDCSVSEVTYVD